ncbi:MAG: transposase [Planctomycetota bacterium]|nr:transposase [Planctomycetota bacterium]
MPRTARLVIPGLPHHVVLRARRGKALFFDDQDRRRFLDLLTGYAASHRLQIRAWCLMPDHVHLVAVPKEAGALAAALMPLQSHYSGHIHRTHKNRGNSEFAADQGKGNEKIGVVSPEFPTAPSPMDTSARAAHSLRSSSVRSLPIAAVASLPPAVCNSWSRNACTPLPPPPRTPAPTAGLRPPLAFVVMVWCNWRAEQD